MPDLRSIGRMLPIPASLRSFLGRRLNLGRVAASQSAPDATPSNVAPGPVAASSPGSWADGAPSPWAAPTSAELAAGAWCPICRWTGAAFEGVSHSESALCPRCGSIARQPHESCVNDVDTPGGGQRRRVRRAAGSARALDPLTGATHVAPVKRDFGKADERP